MERDEEEVLGGFWEWSDAYRSLSGPVRSPRTGASPYFEMSCCNYLAYVINGVHEKGNKSEGHPFHHDSGASSDLGSPVSCGRTLSFADGTHRN